MKIKPRIKLSKSKDNQNKYIINNIPKDKTLTVTSSFGNVTIRISRIIAICELPEGYDDSGCKSSVLVGSNKKAEWINFKEPTWFIISFSGWV